MTDPTYVTVEDVLAILDDFVLPADPAQRPAAPGEVVDALHDLISKMQPRKVPDGGRCIQVELYAGDAGDLYYIEATRNLSGGDALRWAVRIAARELEQRERLARRMASVLQTDLFDTRGYVDTDRDAEAVISKE
jgi:hypothetical protein